MDISPKLISNATEVPFFLNILNSQLIIIILCNELLINLIFYHLNIQFFSRLPVCIGYFFSFSGSLSVLRIVE